MKVIKDQLLATTYRDSHGEKRTLSELEGLFAQMPPEHEINQDHDRSKPTVGRMFNIRLVELEDGEHAIAADIEVFDEEAFVDGGGFSIGYASSRYTINPEELGDVGVIFNPRHFSRQEMEPLAHLSDDAFQVDIVEVKEKTGEEVLKLLLDFLTETAAAYFLTKAGEGVCRKLKSKLIEIIGRKRSEGKNVAVNLRFRVEVGGDETKVIVKVPHLQENSFEEDEVNLETVKTYIEERLGGQAKRVVLTPLSEPPYWQILHFVDTNGRSVEL